MSNYSDELCVSGVACVLWWLRSEVWVHRTAMQLCQAKFHWDQFLVTSSRTCCRRRQLPRNKLATSYEAVSDTPDHLDVSRWSESRQLPCASSPAYYAQGRHHRPQMSKRPCSSVPVQRPIVHWSASDRHELCQRDRILEVPRSRTAMGDWSFSIAGPRVWNTLPASVRYTNSSLRFRKLLKAFLFV